ncbi:MAG: hypothetical protein NVSMB4_12040 [Acidimicrobiales bacterium]
MVIVVYSSGLALSGMGNNPLVSDQPDREGRGPDMAEALRLYESGLSFTR